MIERYQYYCSILTFGLSKFIKEKVRTSPNKKSDSGRAKALSFTVGINITPPNYSFMPENCFKLLFCTWSISYTSYLSQQNLADIDSHNQIFLQFFFVLQFPL